MNTELREAAAERGVTLIALRRGASWSHLVTMLRALTADGLGVGDAETLGGIPSGDLFAVANAVAALVDAPVTIEDRESRVLAFSGRQEEADPSRIETILGRQVPERYSRALADAGVFRELQRSDRPIRVEPVALDDGGFTVPRLAAAVRAGDEFLGSIWVAAAGDISPERERGLRDAATLVALHILRARAGADVQRRLHTELLSTALEGGPGAHAALSRLGIADQPVMIMGVALLRPLARSAGEDAALAGDRSRLADAFAVHLSAVHPGARAALVGDVAYGLVPVGRAPQGDAPPRAAGVEEERALQIARDFLDRVGRRLPAAIGVGPVSRDVGGLARARSTVDRVLRVLRGGTGSRAARLDEVQTEALVIELRDLASTRGDEPTGAIARLIDYDRANDADLVDTLRAWLDALGDVTSAAARLFVHPNTFRYRLRRIAEVGPIDLADPEQRFAAMLQLRVLSSPHE